MSERAAVAGIGHVAGRGIADGVRPRVERMGHR